MPNLPVASDYLGALKQQLDMVNTPWSCLVSFISVYLLMYLSYMLWHLNSLNFACQGGNTLGIFTFTRSCHLAG